MSWLNVAAWLPSTEAEGPGRRAALWVQGCAKRCHGCCNPAFLKLEERHLTPAESVIEDLARAKSEFGIEGVTFLGGEPFLQARGLALVAASAQAMDLSVMVFSGYTMEELHTLQLPGTSDLLKTCDVLVDGPYESQLPDNRRNWVGSRNQRFHYLTERYGPGIETEGLGEQIVEWRIRNDGTMSVNGWPVDMRRTFSRRDKEV